MDTLEKLVSTHPQLVKMLARFRFPNVAQLIASLGTDPEYHANTLRIELLAHLARCATSGISIPTLSDIVPLLKELDESPYLSHEDPSEDLFIGCVNTTEGSFRLFQGIFTDGCFLADRLIEFYSKGKDFPTFQETLKSALAFLRLSDSLANRLHLARNMGGAGNASEDFPNPTLDAVERNFTAVRFEAAELTSLGIELESLAPFILPHSSGVSWEDKVNLWNSDYDSAPLLSDGEAIVIGIPSAFARSLVKFLVKGISIMGGWGHTFYHHEAATVFVNRVANNMEIDAITNPPKTNVSLPPTIIAARGDFDVGKPALLFCYTPESGGMIEDFSGFDTLDATDFGLWKNFLDETIAEITKEPNVVGGLVLVCVAGFGRTIAMPFPELPNNWHPYTATLREWLALTNAAGCTAARLWKLAKHKSLARELGVEFINPGGFPNLLSFWEKSSFRLTPRDANLKSPKNFIVLESDFVKSAYVGYAEARDEHCVPTFGESSWTKVVKHNQGSYFDSHESRKTYVNEELLVHRQLIGCSLRSKHPWWVIAPNARSLNNGLPFVYQLWDCMMEWVDRIVPVALREWPVLSNRSIAIEMELPGVEEWSLDRPSDESRVNALPIVLLDDDAMRIAFRIEEPFLWRFNQPQNLAERLLVATIFQSVSRLAGAPIDELRCSELVSEVAPNQASRHFHLTTTFALEPMLRSDIHTRPLFVEDEDLAFLELGLAGLVDSDLCGQQIDGLDKCLEFLKELVSKVWQRIEYRLALLNHESVVYGCLRAIDELTRDELRWDLTTRSLLALYEDEPSTRRVIAHRRSQRDQAKLANRLVIETAQYSCKMGTRLLFNRDDHSLILAEMSLLIQLSQHRDGIAFGLIEPKLEIFPNGEVRLESAFYESVMTQYHAARSESRTTQAADSYDQHFDTATSEEKTPPHQKWEDCFQIEFGFTVDQWADFVVLLRQFALKSSSSCGELAEPELRALLTVGCQMSEHEATNFLNQFTLPLRNSWNADRPNRCTQEDVYPWRFRRALSLLRRPLVEIQKQPRKWIVSATMLQRSLEYTTYNIQAGYYPERHYASQEMKKYVGECANKSGHAFARKVHDLVKEMRFQTQFEIELTKLGASKHDGLGDIDVLAWRNGGHQIALIECKRLQTAVTVREVIQRLEDFMGDKKERDSLGRHLRRVDWLDKNREKLSILTGIPASELKLVPLLVTSDIVPMQFFAYLSIPTEQVVPRIDLPQVLEKLIPVR